MKRFLSLFLSALVTFQAVNIRCDAASHYRNTAPNYNSVGGAYQGQPVMIMQSSPYIPQQQPVINVALPEQSAPVVNVTPTPQSVTVQSPVNIKKVDATTVGDKIVGWVKCVLYILIAGAAFVSLHGLFGSLKSLDSWWDKKLYSFVAYLFGGEEKLEEKSMDWVHMVLKDTAANTQKNKNKKDLANNMSTKKQWYCGRFSPFC